MTRERDKEVRMSKNMVSLLIGIGAVSFMCMLAFLVGRALRGILSLLLGWSPMAVTFGPSDVIWTIGVLGGTVLCVLCIRLGDELRRVGAFHGPDK